MATKVGVSFPCVIPGLIHVIARGRRIRGNPSLAYLYIFPTDIAPCRMALGDRKILRFVSYSTLEKSPLSKVVKDKIERSRPIWGVGRLCLSCTRLLGRCLRRWVHSIPRLFCRKGLRLGHVCASTVATLALRLFYSKKIACNPCTSDKSATRSRL